ncbi:MAG: ribosome recycling factor [Dehalococcoidia bacterium]|nr:ribosome recycling factor [Dehalococcoidia bacterium]
MIEEVLVDLNSKMQKSVDGLAQELTTIRTGRANPALIENIAVDYHGTPVPIQQIASLSTPEANLIIIQPWDRTSVHNIEKAILKADIGLNPTSDGNVIRVVIPPLSEERRIKLAKSVARKVEERRVALRNIRRDSIAKLKELEKNKEISQDELKINIKKVDGLSDAFIDKANSIGLNKEREIKEI